MTAAAEVDALALMRRVGRLYRALHAAVQPVLERALSLHPKEVQVLGAVAGGQTSPGQISARVGTPPPSTSRLLDRLVAAGLLERQADPDDLRRFRMRLTPEGVATLAAARSLTREALETRLQAVSPASLRAVEQLLGDLEDQLGLQEN